MTLYGDGEPGIVPGSRTATPAIPGSHRSCHPAMKMRFQLLPSGWDLYKHKEKGRIFLLQTCSSSHRLPLPASWLPFSVSTCQLPGFCPEPILSLPVFRRAASCPSALYVHTQSLAARGEHPAPWTGSWVSRTQFTVGFPAAWVGRSWWEEWEHGRELPVLPPAPHPTVSALPDGKPEIDFLQPNSIITNPN